MASRAHIQTLRALVIALVVLCALGTSRSASAQIAQTPRELQHVGVNEHLDAGPLPLDTPFRDHTGKAVTLRSVFDGKRPVVLQFAYFTCPVVCSMITNNVADGLKEIPWTAGKEYEIVTISIDPNESIEKAAAKRAGILAAYGHGLDMQNPNGWHFLVGDQASIAAVTQAAGFEYQYDERQKQWGHPSVVFIVKPNGQLARYIYGLEFPPKDLKLGLFEASEGRSITTVEKLILYCYHYDPQGGKYVVLAMHVMQIGAGGVAAILIGALCLLWLNELKKKTKGGPHQSLSRELSKAEPQPISVRGG